MRVTQETFDEVVWENVKDLELELPDAIADAIEQLTLQGADLSTIDKSIEHFTPSSSSAASHPALDALSRVQTSVDIVSQAGPDVTATQLEQLHDALSEVDKHLENDKETRPLLAAKGAFHTLLAASELLSARLVGAESKEAAQTNSATTEQALVSSLRAVAALLDGNPDLVCPPNPDNIVAEPQKNKAVTQLCKHLSTHSLNAKLQHAAAAAIHNACIMHETNRQTFVAEGLVQLLLAAIDTHSTDRSSAEAVSEAARCLSALTLDDDIRVAFGKAHEHAKLIVDTHAALDVLVPALDKFVGHDASTSSQLLRTLSRVAVRNEYCKQMVDLGVIKLINHAMEAHHDSPEAMAAALGLIKALAGNDDVKMSLGQGNVVEAVVTATEEHIKSASVAGKGCAALAAMCLRSPENSKLLHSANGASLLVRVLTVHEASAPVCKQACRAIRNMVARARDLAAEILGQGAEQLLNNVLHQHAKAADDAKAALRDLGCKVELRELWKGDVKPK